MENWCLLFCFFLIYLTFSFFCFFLGTWIWDLKRSLSRPDRALFQEDLGTKETSGVAQAWATRQEVAAGRPSGHSGGLQVGRRGGTKKQRQLPPLRSSLSTTRGRKQAVRCKTELGIGGLGSDSHWHWLTMWSYRVEWTPVKWKNHMKGGICKMKGLDVISISPLKKVWLDEFGKIPLLPLHQIDSHCI